MRWGEDHTQIPTVFFVGDDLKSYLQFYGRWRFEILGAMPFPAHRVAPAPKCVCLKMLCTPKPNGFADHYPYEKWLFHWEYTQHFQTNPNFSSDQRHAAPHAPRRRGRHSFRAGRGGLLRRAAQWPVFSAGKNGRLGRAGSDVWSVEGDGWPTGWGWWEMGGTKIDVVFEYIWMMFIINNSYIYLANQEPTNL